VNDDFLSLDGDAVTVRRDEQRRQALEMAQLHLVFESDPRARELLDIWTKTFLRRRVSVNAPHTEYAATEAMRSFVQTIHDQIAVAKSGALLAP
jgi:hypothetical protein